MPSKYFIWNHWHWKITLEYKTKNSQQQQKLKTDNVHGERAEKVRGGTPNLAHEGMCESLRKKKKNNWNTQLKSVSTQIKFNDRVDYI